jgi:Ca2+-binding EF-hand superfamily protein
MQMRDSTTTTLTLIDFDPFFKTEEESLAAFKVFDHDDNGDVSRPEFKQTIVEIYKDFDGIEASMVQSNQAIRKLDSLMMVFHLIL